MGMKVEVTLKKKGEINLTLQKKSIVCSVLRRIKVIKCIADLPKRFSSKIELFLPIFSSFAWIKSRFFNLFARVKLTFTIKKISKIVQPRQEYRTNFYLIFDGANITKFINSLYSLPFSYACSLTKLENLFFRSRIFSEFKIIPQLAVHAKLLDYDPYDVSYMDINTLDELDYIIN